MGTEGSKNDRKLDQQLLESYVSFPFLQSLDGKVVACTGATVGSLGYYVALTAIAKGARAIVLLNREGSRAIDAENSLKSFAQDMNESEKNGDEGTELCEIKTFYCELTSLFWVKSAVAGAQNFVKKFGGLDVLINCAGVAGYVDIELKCQEICSISYFEFDVYSGCQIYAQRMVTTFRCKRIIFHMHFLPCF